MTYAIRYRPGSLLATRFGDHPAGSYPTWQAAEDVRRACANGDDMEVVER